MAAMRSPALAALLFLASLSTAGAGTHPCDDDNSCTTDSGDPETGCVHQRYICNDGVGCTDDSCDPVKGCVFVPHSCDDSDPCTVDSCEEGGCLGAFCHEPTPICINAPMFFCDDGDACTVNTCDATGCLYPPRSCDDANACTEDGCDSSSGCLHEEVACDDGLICTFDACAPESGCVTFPVDCGDGSRCTTEICTEEAGCLYDLANCDDGDPCTLDACDPIAGCFHDGAGAGVPDPRTVAAWEDLCGSPEGPGDGDVPCVQAQGATFAEVSGGAGLCRVLGQTAVCGHAEAELMALALNRCGRNVCGDAVSQAYDEADRILSNPLRRSAECARVRRLLDGINTGRPPR